MTMRGDEFEGYVRRVAKARWPGVEGGSEIIAGCQIDGVFRTSEITHLVEGTIERSMEKVRADINKLVAARREEQTRAFLVDCWMVMLAEPTPDQRQLATTSQVRLVTIDEFRDPAICKTEYLYLRSRHGFGSIGDPANELSPNDIAHIQTPIAIAPETKDYALDHIVSHLREGRTVILLGDYGAGKSITVREIYRRLEGAPDDYRTSFPVAINLREHWGQEHGVEVFIRHAQKLGSSNGLQLYHAWKEGFITLLLDGFDEVAPQPWTYEKPDLARIRRRAMAAVRDIVDFKPRKAGLLISGRSHYFSNEEELLEALGIQRGDATIAELRELTDTEASDFLKRFGVSGSVSEYLPRRPLLLSYLARTGYVSELAGLAGDQEVGHAWTKIIEMVCSRETLTAAAINRTTISKILHHLAHLMRFKPDRLGPISDGDLEQAFRSATAHQPDHDAWAILQRLPSITFRSEGQKWFVDDEWADALTGLAFADIVCGFIPTRTGDVRIRHSLGYLGQMVAASAITHLGKKARDLVSWAHGASRDHADATLLADAVAVARSMDDSPIDFHGLTIKEAICGEVSLAESNLVGVQYDSCLFDLLSIPSSDPTGVTIQNSIVSVVEGVSATGNLPQWITDCVIDVFRFPTSNAEVLRMNLPEPVKVGIVILRKIYIQKGRGRKYSALMRGLEPSQVETAKKAITTLLRLGYASSRRQSNSETIVHPVRSRIPEVRSQLQRTPTLGDTPWKEILEDSGIRRA